MYDQLIDDKNYHNQWQLKVTFLAMQVASDLSKLSKMINVDQ